MILTIGHDILGPVLVVLQEWHSADEVHAGAEHPLTATLVKRWPICSLRHQTDCSPSKILAAGSSRCTIMGHLRSICRWAGGLACTKEPKCSMPDQLSV